MNRAPQDLCAPCPVPLPHAPCHSGTSSRVTWVPVIAQLISRSGAPTCSIEELHINKSPLLPGNTPRNLYDF